MAITYPTSLDNFTNPTATDTVATVDHAAQHSNANDAIEALEAKVGVNGSAVTTSHDYKLSGVTGTDKSVSKTGTETLTNKTLTSPTITSPIVSNPTSTGTDTGTQTLTNKTITDSTNNVTARSLKSASTTVDVSAATAPSNGQVLTATSSTTATWQSVPSPVYSGVSVTKSSTATVTGTTSPATIAWDTENFDTDGYHDNATNNSRLTAPSTGKYLVTASILVTSTLASGFTYITFVKNGSTTVGRGSADSTNNVSSPGGVGTSTVLSLTAGDYIEVTIAGDFTAGTLTYGASGSSFTMSKLGS